MKKEEIRKQLKYLIAVKNKSMYYVLVFVGIIGLIVMALFAIKSNDKIISKLLAYLVVFGAIALLIILQKLFEKYLRSKMKNRLICSYCDNTISNEYDMKIVISTNKCPYCGENIIE